MRPGWRCLAAALVSFGLTACDPAPETSRTADGHRDKCDPDDGSLILPAGFCARVVADNLGFVRHIAVDRDGDIYAALRNLRFDLGGILGLRDTSGDGRMDVVEQFSETPGMAIEIQDNWLYFGADDAVYRYQLGGDGLVPPQPPQTVVGGFPTPQSEHTGKTFAFDGQGSLYVNVGAPSNACQSQDRKAGSQGKDPCPELERQGGIWRFPADATGQSQSDGERYASGIRNAYAIAWSRSADSLYVLQHGRDQLHELWPDEYSTVEGAELPAEEFIQVVPDTTYGWPYCYYDHHAGRMILAPEYGGDGVSSGRCSDYPQPLLGFPAHYSPNDMVFYEAQQFPEHYRDGNFIAFHGSYNRGDLKQVGYQVVFVPFKDGQPDGDWTVFADGFAGDGGPVATPEDAEYRPTGLAIGPDGSLYISDSVQGRIWRVSYLGDQAGSPAAGESSDPQN